MDAFGENSIASAGIRKPDPPSRILDTTPNMRSQLLSFLWDDSRLLFNDDSIDGYMEANNDTVIGKLLIWKFGRRPSWLHPSPSPVYEWD